MKYFITKALVIYRSQEIIKCLYGSPEDFLEELKKFFRDRIEYNKNNLELKQAETMTFQEILLVLDEISDAPKLDWDYHMSFDGFNKYLQEKDIQNYSLIIDKEGELFFLIFQWFFSPVHWPQSIPLSLWNASIIRFGKTDISWAGAAYVVLGVTTEGYKDILNITVGANENSFQKDLNFHRHRIFYALEANASRLHFLKDEAYRFVNHEASK